MRNDREQYIVRFPDGMRERIKEEAERNQRSMNAEIVFHLKRALFDPLCNAEHKPLVKESQ